MKLKFPSLPDWKWFCLLTVSVQTPSAPAYMIKYIGIAANVDTDTDMIKYIDIADIANCKINAN